MRCRTLFVIGSVLLATAGCMELASPGRPIDQQIVLAPSQSAAVPGAGISIRFAGVLGDSRCPADAMCVLGGDAVARIVVAGDAPAEYELHTGDMKPVRHDGLTIALVRLEPYPFSARPIDPADYRLTLRVTR